MTILDRERLGTEGVSVGLLRRFDKPVPRYTSYPTAPEWGQLSPLTYQEGLKEISRTPKPLSLYFHIPFCKSMCLYCGCSVILNRKPENEERYVQYLLREIDLVADHLGSERQSVAQIAFGGGTPTKLSCEQLTRIMERIEARFSLIPGGEFAMEVDPRTVLQDSAEKLHHLKKLGFSRVSFGVQDTDPRVQQAVRRYQSYEASLETYERARNLGFDGINIDLIYGLPLQTPESFSETISKILEMRPNRIALFSYAKVPWLKPHQKAIPEESLPSTEDKFRIYIEARQRLLASGYLALGMDHFALRDDPLSQAYLAGTLHRNFQGYTLALAEDMLGFGVTAIGDCRGAYVQNVKDLPDYYQAIDQGELPVFRGKVLSADDKIRRVTINQLMCRFGIDKEAFRCEHGMAFDDYFAEEQDDILRACDDGLLVNDQVQLNVTETGRLFVRNLAAIFDAYLRRKGGTGRFSKGV